MRVDIPVILVVRHQSPMLATVEEDCTSGLVIEVFDDLDKVGADVVQIHGFPQSCMHAGAPQSRSLTYESSV